MTHKALPNLGYLNERYALDEVKGYITFKKRGFGVTVGKRCGSPRPDGYRRIKINGSLYLEHRIVFFMYYGIDPMKSEVDHIDRDRGNNNPKNLRLVNRSKNKINSDAYSNNKTGYRGVYWHTQSRKYRALIRKDKIDYHLGNFDCKHDAAEAYNTKSKDLYREFAYQNKIERGA